MGYKYNDAEMLMATQVAYLDCDNLKGRSVKEIYDTYLNQYCHLDANGNYVQNDNLTDYATKCAETVLSMNHLIQETPALEAEIGNWSVIDVCNENNESGFYGMVIDTGDNNAIIGCRGSESYDTHQFVYDWGVADVGLLDNVQTRQQADAEQYMQQIYYKYGDKYDSFSLTGHSLGGNLAEHMTITAPAGMRDKIDHTISFDGPGFSDEYIKAHRKEIERVAGKMDHYKWSVISSMLNPLPGVTDTVIKAHNDPSKDGIASMLFRHATTNVELSNGQIQRGEGDELSSILGPFSRLVDNELAFFGTQAAVNAAVLMEIATNPLSIFYPTPIKCLGVVINVVGLVKCFINALRVFEKVANAVKSFTDNLYYNLIAPNVSGEYTVDTNAMKVNADELLRTARVLQNKAHEIDNIRRNLQYWSEIGGFYRSRIMILNTAIQFEIGRIQKLGDMVPQLMERYDKADQITQDSFCSIKNTA